MLDLQREFVEEHLAEMFCDIRSQMRFRGFDAGRFLMNQHLALPCIREFLYPCEPAWPVIEGIESREYRIKKALSDPLRFEFGDCAEHLRYE